MIKSTKSCLQNRRFFVRKQRPFPSHAKKHLPALCRVYALTLSSNYAKDKDAFQAYDYVISQLPTGTFYYTREKSKYGKYHVHGTLFLKYNFDYKTLQASKLTENGNEFNLHIEYKKITYQEGWDIYSSKSGNPLHVFHCDLDTAKNGNVPLTCIPQIKKFTFYKPMSIPGIY